MGTVYEGTKLFAFIKRAQSLNNMCTLGCPKLSPIQYVHFSRHFWLFFWVVWTAMIYHQSCWKPKGEKWISMFHNSKEPPWKKYISSETGFRNIDMGGGIMDERYRKISIMSNLEMLTFFFLSIMNSLNINIFKNRFHSQSTFF